MNEEGQAFSVQAESETIEALTQRIALARARSELLATEEPVPLQSQHVLERLRLFQEDHLTDPSATAIVDVQEFCALAFYHGLERDVATALATGALSYATAVRDGALVRLKYFFMNYDVLGDGTPTPFALPICIGELHCPITKGAKATFSCSSEHEDAIGLEIRVAGIAGGGWKRSRVYCAESVIPINAGYCSGLYVHMTGNYSIWKHLDDDSRIVVLTNVLNVGTYVFPSQLPNSDSHLCAQPDSYEMSRRDIARYGLRLTIDYERLTPATLDPEGESSTHTVSWSSSREYDASLGFSASYQGLELGRVGVTTKSRFLRKMSVAVTCPPNHDYIGRYRNASALPLQWSVSDE